MKVRRTELDEARVRRELRKIPLDHLRRRRGKGHLAIGKRKQLTIASSLKRAKTCSLNFMWIFLELSNIMKNV